MLCKVFIFLKLLLSSWSGYGFQFRSTRPFISPPPHPKGLVNWFQTGFGRTKHWLVHRMATASRCIGEAHKLPPRYHMEVECVALPAKGLINAVFYPLSLLLSLLIFACPILFNLISLPAVTALSSSKRSFYSSWAPFFCLFLHLLHNVFFC